MHDDQADTLMFSGDEEMVISNQDVDNEGWESSDTGEGDAEGADVCVFAVRHGVPLADLIWLLIWLRRAKKV